MKKVLLILALALFAPIGAFAATNINSVTFDGGTSTTTTPGATVLVEVSVTTTSSDDWESTSYNIIPDGNLVDTCVNTPDHTASGTFTASFSTTTPVVDGVYDFQVKAFGLNGAGDDDTCSAGVDDTETFVGVITVATPVVIIPPPATTTPPIITPVQRHRSGDARRCVETTTGLYCPQGVSPSPWQTPTDPRELQISIIQKLIGLIQELMLKI